MWSGDVWRAGAPAGAAAAPAAGRSAGADAASAAAAREPFEAREARWLETIAARVPDGLARHFARRAEGATEASGAWLHSPTWDGLFVFASVLLIALPLLTYHGIAALTGTPPEAFQDRPALSIAMFINLAIAFGIGGPHVYATYTLTLAERRFRRRHPLLLWAGLAIPVAVVSLAALRIELLIALFFGWASVHVIHQLVFLVQQYQDRSARPIGRLSRWIDYALVASCLYPVASFRLLAEPGASLALPGGLTVSSGFLIGAVDVSRQLPGFLQGQLWLAWIPAGIFAVSLAAFLVRTLHELLSGRWFGPRTLLVGLTAPVAFCLPLFDNLDVALQGFNLWHSVQYIGLVYLMNRVRRARGEISSPLVDAISGPERWPLYYAFIVGVSVAVGGLIGVLHFGLGLPMLQVYYAVHLSGLLVHYLWDHAVFTQRDALTA